jgi:hypothetical protein
VNADPAVLARESTAHADAILRQGDQTSAVGAKVSQLVLTRALQSTGVRAAAPGSGTWARGDIVLNTDPVAGGFIGWVCTAAGTPGTWKSWGAISP